MDCTCSNLQTSYRVQWHVSNSIGLILKELSNRDVKIYPQLWHWCDTMFNFLMTAACFSLNSMRDKRYFNATLYWHHNGCDGVSNHQLRDCLFSRLIWCRSKKTSKLRVTGLCAGNSPVTGEFPAQMASNAEYVPIWWRHHEFGDFTSLVTDPMLISYHKYRYLTTLRPRQNGRHFPHDNFKRIFLNENAWVSINISLKFVAKGPVNNIPALVQIMAWRRPGNKPLSKPVVVSLLTHICVTWPHWVDSLTLGRYCCNHKLVIFKLIPRTHVMIFS